MKQFNGVKLVGDVLAVNSTGLLMETIFKTVKNGEPVEYGETHEVLVRSKKALKGIKEGMRIKLFGNLEQIDKRTKIVADVKTITPCEDEYINLAKLIGRSAGAFRYYAAVPGKQAFGNLLVEVNGVLFRSVLFDTLATAFSRICKRNSTVKVQGRLRQRKYDNGQGDTDKMLELIADPDETQVLVVATPVDEFAEWGAEPADETPATPASKAAPAEVTSDESPI